jgi:uncharacterized protein
MARGGQRRLEMAEILLWRRLDVPGHEIGKLQSSDNGWELSGTAIFAHDRRPCRLDYLVQCDTLWRTRTAKVKGIIGDRDIDLQITIDAERKWYLNGAECPSVADCQDIDLGFSPSTNVLPIRRLSLAVGEETEVRAAWLPFPRLTFELLPQVYRREGERTYRYESRGGAFVRTLEVNAAGLVTSYPGLWEAEPLA